MIHEFKSLQSNIPNIIDESEKIKLESDKIKRDYEKLYNINKELKSIIKLKDGEMKDLSSQINDKNT